MPRMLPLLLLLFATAAWSAGVVHKCRHADGRISFSDVKCASGSEPQSYRPDAISLVKGGGLSADEQQLLRQLRRRDAVRQRTLERRRDTAPGVSGFERRKMLRELRMRRSALQGDLRLQGEPAERRALERRIADIDRQIGRLAGGTR